MGKKVTEEELLQMEMVGGGKVHDLINEHPEINGWRTAIIKGAYECLRLNWPLHEMNIEVAARQIDREEMRRRGTRVS